MSRGFVTSKAAALFLVLTACYTQRPLETPIPTPATRIVAQVTDSGAVAVGTSVGPGASEVEGVVTTADAAVWNLSLVRVDYRGGNSVIWNREQVSFPRYALSNPTEKRVDKARSWMAAGLITLGAFLAGRMFSQLAADSGGEPEPPPPN